MPQDGGESSSHVITSGQRLREAVRAAVQRPARVRQHLSYAADTPSASPASRLFISYAREDLEAVRPLVMQVRKEGIVVNWDQEFFGGADFRQAICKAIDDARSVLVVWSPTSALSPFVCDEAARALNARKLITTHVAGFNLRELPLGFGHLNTLPIGDWERVRSSLVEHGFRLGARSRLP